MLRIDLSTLAVSHVIPGGTAGGTGLGYRLFTSNGVNGTDAGFALATQGIGSAVVLNAMLWVALVISIPLHGFNSAYVTVAVVGAVLLAAFGALVLAFTRGERRARPGAAGRRPAAALGHRGPDGEARATSRRRGCGPWPRTGNCSERRVCGRRRTGSSTPPRSWAFVAAYGHITSPIDLFVAYGVANILAAVPLTPGGLGIVEAVAATTLIGFGVPAGIAWLGVISWRLFNFWLPIPVGAGAYLSLRVRRGAGLKERRDALEDMTRAAGTRTLPRPAQTPRRQAETSLLGYPGLQLLRPRRHHLKADRELEQLLEEHLLALQHPALELGVAAGADDDLDRRPAQLDAEMRP